MAKLQETSKNFPQTLYWNDSCSLIELAYAIERGGVGATTNPVIVKTVLENEFETYKDVLTTRITSHPHDTEDDHTWYMIEYAAQKGAELLRPLFDPRTGKGRLSIQTNTKYYKNATLLIEQAMHFFTLAQNIQVKLPATKAGIVAIEEVTYRGVSINATVSFSVSQALAVAEAVERGLLRRKEEGKSNEHINPVCTIMVGRIDDWLKQHVDAHNIILDPECLELAGVAVMKHAYTLYNQHHYRTTLLAAAYRNHYHWSQFIGANMILTITHKWQKRLNDSSISVTSRIDDPLPDHILSQLQTLDEFAKVYNADGMQAEDFEYYGAARNTLLQFAHGYDDLVKIIRAEMLRR